nr:MAG TPA: hypothetical protein [Caudoviricetes sp.]
MKYVLYIDYSASYKPMTYEYRAMNAKNIKDAILEADAIHDTNTMYLIRIMEKTGKVEKVESDVKAQTYTAIIEKRSTKWAAMDQEQVYNGQHQVKYFYAKFANWFETV